MEYQAQAPITKVGSQQVKHQNVKDERKAIPDINAIESNVNALAGSIVWLEDLIKQRMSELSGGARISIEQYAETIDKTFLKDSTAFYQLLMDYSNSYVEYLMLSLAFTAWFRPRSLKGLVVKKEDSDELYAETGILGNGTNSRYLPTLQTVLFLLAGTNTVKQAYYHSIVLQHSFFKDQVLQLRKPYANNNFPLDYILEMDLAYYNYLLNGKKPRFDSSVDFPATLLETDKKMDDLVLKESTKEQMQVIINFAKHQYSLFEREGVKEKIKPGMLAMLYGPPGTGKTFSLAVISNYLGIDAYRVDLSRVISKYIGETEKNLEKVFERLSDKKCILFFDEADVLFGKRSEVKDAKDRYANQEVAYLLQRVEQFPGLVILASNFKQNLDSAFKRRILVSVYMPPPDAQERLVLWNNSIPAYFKFETDEMPDMLAEKHSFTGANITNIIKLACLQAESEGTNIITHNMLKPFINREYSKEGLQNRKTV